MRCTSNATPVARALHLIRRLRKPKEVAAITVQLCSDAASFATGHPMAIDGGLAAS
ncbi:MAG TPA: SDR family oxidoreductase [Anaerolineae bacterium]|nr:SDR family oxidoreductase [Anaerolineae bacterium]